MGPSIMLCWGVDIITAVSCDLLGGHYRLKGRGGGGAIHFTSQRVGRGRVWVEGDGGMYAYLRSDAEMSNGCQGYFPSRGLMSYHLCSR